MAIDTRCPHCQTKYRLKDELSGKSVTCREAACRKVFAVVALPPAANGTHPPKAKRAAEPPPAVDAETLAASLFADEPAAAPVAERQVAVVCEICEHKWTEPASKVGKVVLCPECKHRQKIPEPKKKTADWRDATGGRRLLEKGPDLPKDLEEQQMREASLTSLVGAGVIEKEEVEPRTLKEKLAIVAVVAVVLAVLGGGVWWLLRTRSQGKEVLLAATAVDEIKEIKDDGPLPKGQPPLLRAALHLATGEAAVRQNTEEGLKDALKHFADARNELQAAPRSFERDAVFSELATAVLATGGDNELVKGKSRIGWTPHAAAASQPGTGQSRFVQVELRLLLSSMKDYGVDPEMRVLTARRLTRELVENGQPDLLFEVLQNGFDPTEQQEARAQALLAAVRANAAADKLRPHVDQLRNDVTNAGEKAVTPITAAAVFRKFGITDVPAQKLPPVWQPGAAPSIATRLAYVPYLVLDDKPDAALTLATVPTSLPEMVMGLAVLAEAAADPKPALSKAVEVTQNQRESLKGMNPVYLLRLVRAAAAAGVTDQADALAQVIADDGLREWARAEALRARWAAGKAAVPAADAPKTEPGKLHVGHAWGCLLLARHNAAATGAADPAAYDAWGKGELRGFGYAGAALGLKDRK